MKIIALRHTSVSCSSGTCYGQTDVETAQTYESEKEKIILNLKSVEFDLVYSSPLTRCRKLAEEVSRGVPVIYDPRLMELNFGDWENRRWEEFYFTPKAQLWFSDWLNISCPNGESYGEMMHRVKCWLDDLYNNHTDGNILIITHAGVIRALVSLLTDIATEKIFDIKVGYGAIVNLSS